MPRLPQRRIRVLLLAAIILIVLLVRWVQIWTTRSDARERLDSALIGAIRRDDVARIKTLLQHGANPNTQTYTTTGGPHSFWRTLLDTLRGAHRPTHHPAPLFVALGGTENADTDGASYTIEDNGVNISVIRTLLDGGANLNASDSSDQTPLFVAALDGREDIVGLLLDRGVNVNSTSGGIRESVLEVAVGTNAGGDEIGVIKLLLKRGANINAQDNAGMTPLMEAALHGDIKVVQILLNHSADVRIKDNSGRTAAQWVQSMKSSTPQGTEQFRQVARLLQKAAAQRRGAR